MVDVTPLLSGLIGNVVSCTTPRYAAIIGQSPSKGARSPRLWNAAFSAARIDAEMLPLDVPEGRLEAVISALRSDSRFIGGAVTMPYKQAILPFLDRSEPEAERIGAVNALYRDGENLIGANTDGASALAEIEKLAGSSLAGRRAVVLGTGGLGVAVAAYLAGRVGQLTLLNRTMPKAQEFAKRLVGQANVSPWPVTAGQMASADILVNCTSVGHASGDVSACPLGPDFSRLLTAMPAGAIVFDAIYQPDETVLLRQARARGLHVANGLGMNLEQAVLAFARACPQAFQSMRIERDHIRNVMAKAGS